MDVLSLNAIEILKVLLSKMEQMELRGRTCNQAFDFLQEVAKWIDLLSSEFGNIKFVQNILSCLIIFPLVLNQGTGKKRTKYSKITNPHSDRPFA